MLEAQFEGAGIQSSLLRKKGAVKMVDPMTGSCSGGYVDLNFVISVRNDSSDGAPFFIPNASQARDKGRFECLTKKLPPTMKF